MDSRQSRTHLDTRTLLKICTDTTTLQFPAISPTEFRLFVFGERSSNLTHDEFNDWNCIGHVPFPIAIPTFCKVTCLVAEDGELAEYLTTTYAVDFRKVFDVLRFKSQAPGARGRRH
ncbi:hypothetical protein BD311DRAFT_830123 [Dichomitus squalens]|uniref:Uncharacterized protein n=1 Tax=Dichomitus squalens TaxID=114155 RepID=A0A4Q9M493_9APHY|nr:hypothetical protein BD311DRAFT_830123 [Dichomitus squalens]